MIWEVISRILYFIGLRWILVTWGRLDFASALPIGVMVWLLYVVSTQMSVIAWSQIKKSAFWIVAGNVLVQTVIAVYIFSVVIN
ncbi:hypothetical protein KA478_02010 [Patescibacteria group bacterium]|nr:hypothetical protein [Patescibacteria group bacterium]